MSRGSAFEDCMKENHARVKAFASNPDFHKILVDIFLAAKQEARRMGIHLEDLEVKDALLAHGKVAHWKLVESEASKQKKASPILGLDGFPMRH